MPEKELHVQQSGKYTKGYQPASANTPAAKQAAPRVGTGNKPSKRLSVKQDGNFSDITGLFETVSKKSGAIYFTGKDRTTGTKYFLFEDKKKGTNEVLGYTLCVRDGEGDDAKFVQVAKLKNTKNGKLVGNSVTNPEDSFWVSDIQPNA